MASAAFQINGTAVPQASGNAVEITGGATITLALSSTVGAETIAWAVVGVSGVSVASPTITRAGSPLGATATFTSAAQPTDGSGLSYALRCRVTDGNGEVVEAWGICGIPNVVGAIPAAYGEQEGWRHATLGWTPLFNQAINGFPYYAGSATTTSTTAHTASTVIVPPGKLARIDCVWSAYDAVAGHYLYRQASALFKNTVAGTSASQVSTDSETFDFADDASWTASFLASGSSVAIRYSGDATNSTSWRFMVWRTLMGL